MPEVLHLNFHASTRSLHVKLDATHEYERDGKKIVGVIAGVPLPGRECTLDQLVEQAARLGDPTLAADFLAIVMRMEPVFRAWVEEDIKDPVKMREEAARIGAQRHALRANQDAHDKAREDREAAIAVLNEAASKAKAEADALEAQRVAAEKAHVEVEALLTAKRKELETVSIKEKIA